MFRCSERSGSRAMLCSLVLVATVSAFRYRGSRFCSLLILLFFLFSVLLQFIGQDIYRLNFVTVAAVTRPKWRMSDYPLKQSVCLFFFFLPNKCDFEVEQKFEGLSCFRRGAWFWRQDENVKKIKNAAHWKEKKYSKKCKRPYAMLWCLVCLRLSFRRCAVIRRMWISHYEMIPPGKQCSSQMATEKGHRQYRYVSPFTSPRACWWFQLVRGAHFRN